MFCIDPSSAELKILHDQICKIYLSPQVSAPGVWLPSREDVYLSICLFGQYRTTRLVTSVFPLPLHEHFVFEKVIMI